MSINKQTETLSFQAEVKQLLNLVTHSLYSNKEIFLRELISNSSDAADKLRFEALADNALYEGGSELKIWVDFDAKARTIIVRDNGIGMNREEVVANLGTIAKSGTREFLAALTGDKAKDTNLIGQFGVGFYSSFVVAEKVSVKTRRAGMSFDQGVVWESRGDGEYTITNSEVLEHGTEVTLFLKPDEQEFLDYWRLKGVIGKYSDHIILPILMKKPVTEAAEGEEKDKDKDKTPEVLPAEMQWEVVNRATALWALPKKDIKDEQYKELYKHITHDFSDPLLWIHNVVEGKLEYTTLLYIPEHAPFDLWHRDHKHGLKLYVQRVFIMDDAEQLLPNYLRFVRGIVDSKDLPLNVSREILQSNKVIEGIRSSIVKRVLDVLEKMAKDDSEKYAKFWKAFGQALKEGMVEDFASKDKIAKLLRLNSTYLDSTEQTVSLDDYISRMQKEQDKIYYITADGYTAAKNSPHLEVFKKKGIEVLLLGDRIDEWMLSGLYEYEGKQLQSIAKGDIDLSKLEDKDEQKEQKEHKEEQDKKAKEEFGSVLKQMKEVLGERVEEVRLSHRLVDSPSCLVSGQFDMSLHLQRIMQAAGQDIPKGKQILEINPKHPLVERIKTESDDQRFAEWTNLLFEQALLAGGGQLDDPASFVRRMNALLVGVAG